MKTNVITQHPMGNFVVEQRTKDGMFNAALSKCARNPVTHIGKCAMHFTLTSKRMNLSSNIKRFLSNKSAKLKTGNKLLKHNWNFAMR